jgi:hypothetical protein
MIYKYFPVKFELNFTVLFTVLTAIGYYASYNYEVSYCGAFGVPQEYVNIDFSNIIPFTVKIFLAALYIISGIYGIPKLDEHLKKKSRVLRIMGFYNAMNIYLNVALFAVFPYRNQIVYFAAATFIILNIVAIITIIRKKPFDPYKPAVLDLPENTTEDIIYKREVASLQLTKYVLIFLVFTFMAASTSIDQLARKDAYAKTDFLVMKDDPNEVLIKKFGDKYIFLRFDTMSNKLTKEITVVNVGSGASLTPRSFEKLLN